MKTKFGLAAQAVCILCLVGTTLFLLIFWNRIPAEIPGHYNGAGEIDSMTGKGSLLIPLVFNWLMFMGITGLECLPEAWNTGVRGTAQNRAKVYRNIYHMIVCSKLAMVLTVGFFTIWPLTGENAPFWVMPILLGAAFGPIIFFSIRLWRAR